MQRQTRLESVTGRFVIMSVSMLAGIAAFGWVLATYQPSTLDLLRASEDNYELGREVGEFQRRAQSAAYEFQFREAIRHQRNVVELEPYKTEHWLKLAEFYEADEQTRKARDARQKAASVQLDLAKAHQDDADSWRQAAILLRTVGRSRDATNAYQRAAATYIDEAQDSDSSYAWAQGATILTDLGRIADARRAWLSAGEAAEAELRAVFAPRTRNDAASWRQAGEYFMKAGEPDRARQVFREAVPALQMASDRPFGATVPNRNDQWSLLIWAGYNLGWVHRHLGQEAEAQVAWERALRYIEAMANMPERRGSQEWYNRACLRALTGDRDGAIDALERAVRSRPVSRQHALADDDLRSLHDDERFHALISLLDDDPASRPWR